MGGLVGSGSCFFFVSTSIKCKTPGSTLDDCLQSAYETQMSLIGVPLAACWPKSRATFVEQKSQPHEWIQEADG